MVGEYLFGYFLVSERGFGCAHDTGTLPIGQCEVRECQLTREKAPDTRNDIMSRSDGLHFIVIFRSHIFVVVYLLLFEWLLALCAVRCSQY